MKQENTKEWLRDQKKDTLPPLQKIDRVLNLTDGEIDRLPTQALEEVKRVLLSELEKPK